MPTLENKRRSYIPARPRRAQQGHGNRRLYKSNAWRVDSEVYRQENPLCELCLQSGKYTDCSPGGNKGVTDHIVSTTVGGAQRDPANYMTLCHAHHNRKRGYESQTTGPLVETTTNEDGELVPARRGEVYELFT